MPGALFLLGVQTSKLFLLGVNASELFLFLPNAWALGCFVKTPKIWHPLISNGLWFQSEFSDFKLFSLIHFICPLKGDIIDHHLFVTFINIVFVSLPKFIKNKRG